MRTSERIIGKLEEAYKGLTSRLDSTDARLEKIDSKVDKLIELKWRMAGGAAVISILATLLIEVFLKGA